MKDLKLSVAAKRKKKRISKAMENSLKYVAGDPVNLGAEIIILMNINY